MKEKERIKGSKERGSIPYAPQSNWEDQITLYLSEVEQLNTETARSHRFSMLLQGLFGFETHFIESYCRGIEKYLKVKQKDRILKGETDNLFGNVIIEFESDIFKKRTEAERQLRHYTAILWSQEPIDLRTPYLCIATDGVRFVTYAPAFTKTKVKDVDPDDVHLNVLEEADWTKFKPPEVFYWLDRYFLRKEVLLPTSETIVRDFGAKSHAFQTTTNALLRLWQEIKPQSAFSVIYQTWEKYLRIVYGSAVGKDELFISHTYLATLAKLMSWMRVTESVSLPDDKEIGEILEGEFFKKQGIENFTEEDFFSWVARSKAVKMGVSVVRWLFSLLQNYRLGDLSEDVLKSLYQELVDPETRHDLGEFYTPDWLAHRIVNKLLDTNPQGAMFDPACGSGTFLYLAVREKRRRSGDHFETLEHILDSVYGADIHPLAVMVAKTNYILALSDLLKKRKGPITIPIYLADTLKLPEFVKQAPAEVKGGVLIPQLPSYQVELDGQKINLPERLFEDVAHYDQAVELAKDYALQNKGKSITFKTFFNFLVAQHFPKVGDQALVQALYSIAERLKHFIDNERDTIWAFVLKNIYKPLFYKRKFDFIMGNPPWISLRYMEPLYQDFLKRQITEEYRLLAKRGELITHWGKMTFVDTKVEVKY
jgi:hypothetical protein